MVFESRKAKFCQLSTGSAVRGGQNRGQDFGPKRYGPHAVHGGRKKLSGGEGERGRVPPVQFCSAIACRCIPNTSASAMLQLRKDWGELHNLQLIPSCL
jgi:hypothetical protein